MQANVFLVSQGNQIWQKTSHLRPIVRVFGHFKATCLSRFLSQFEIKWIEKWFKEIGLEMMKILSQTLTERSTWAAKTVEPRFVVKIATEFRNMVPVSFFFSISF